MANITQTAEDAGTASEPFVDEKVILQRVPISRRTLYVWRESGKVPFIKVPGSRRVVFHWASFEQALLRLQRGRAA